MDEIDKAAAPAVQPVKKKKKKLIHIEMLRALCIWLVMFTHTSTAGFSLYLNAQASPWFPLYIMVPFWVKTAVPVFFMISGALLLGKDEPISVIYKKRVWRFVQVIVIFSAINYLAVYRDLDFRHFFTLTYSSTLATAYYFLYLYLGFLFMLPIWRALVRQMTNKLYLYLIGLNLVFVGFVPILSFLLFKGSAEINYFVNPLLAVSEPTFYFLIGYWIEHVLPVSWITKKNLIRLGLAAAAGTCIAAGMTWYHGVVAGGLTEAISQRFYDSFLFLNTAFVFLCCRYWFMHHPATERTRKFWSFLGKVSFGIMLFDDMLRHVTRPVLNKLLAMFPSMPFTDAVLWIMVAFTLGIGVSYVVGKLPYIRKLI
jgi:surface polysaccharide O-acyltransferase-like enzyme